MQLDFPPGNFWSSFFLYLIAGGVVILGVGIISALAALAVQRAAKDLFRAFLAVSSCAFVAFTVAFVAAASRETVTGDVLPLFLSGFGVLLGLSVIKSEVPLPLAFFGAVAVSVGLAFGMHMGAYSRDFLNVAFKHIKVPTPSNHPNEFDTGEFNLDIPFDPDCELPMDSDGKPDFLEFVQNGCADTGSDQE